MYRVNCKLHQQSRVKLSKELEEICKNQRNGINKADIAKS
jgi:hypothetical protein